MNMAPCMGGWCARRDHCPHYHAKQRSEPAERLCPPKQDGKMLGAIEIPAMRMAPGPGPVPLVPA